MHGSDLTGSETRECSVGDNWTAECPRALSHRGPTSAFVLPGGAGGEILRLGKEMFVELINGF